MENGVEKTIKKLPAAAVAVIDVLLTVIFLFVFAVLPHGLAANRATAPSVSPAVTSSLPETEEMTQPMEAAKELTEWQEKFAEHFSDEVVSTESSYKSPYVSVELETITTGEGSHMITYHVADIYIASLENFSTYTANGELKYFSTQDVLEMDAASRAVIAISGDFYSYQSSGLLVRNGQIYSDDYAYCDICVMYPDGSIETYSSGSYDKDDLLAKGPSQIWNFGPSLLDGEGRAKEYYQVSSAVSYPNPRSALGYYEPGHYCFVVVDGRQEGYSAGMTLPQLASVFEELGCTSAYNLDGGGTAVMTFAHQRYSRQSNGGDRLLGDILLICDTEAEK